jgi:protein YIPF6
VKEMTAFLFKVRYVILMLPKHREQSINCLRKWDLWGPMIICLFFAIPMSVVSEDPLYEEDFINVFLIFWVGSLLVSVNCKLLGSKGYPCSKIVLCC